MEVQSRIALTFYEIEEIHAFQGDHMLIALKDDPL